VQRAFASGDVSDETFKRIEAVLVKALAALVAAALRAAKV